MNKEINDVIIAARKRALRDVTVASGKRFKVTKDFKTGKIVFKPKESDMTELLNINYLQYDTRTV